MNKYITILNEIKAIIDPRLPLISNLSNVSALLNKMNDINWCGFYIVSNRKLYLGPFQGEVACTVIEKGKGVCGKAFELKKSIIVDDVDKFPGHIRCSSLSKSEIVVPIIKNGKVKAVIDFDSPIYSRFSQEELNFLEDVSDILKSLSWKK